jgi:hypothetical protein
VLLHPTCSSLQTGIGGLACTQGNTNIIRAHTLSYAVQGTWYAFRCAAAGDHFLQVRKRVSSCSRLALYNTNVGTWEQWELGKGSVDATAWTAVTLTFRHRRLPQVRMHTNHSQGHITGRLACGCMMGRTALSNLCSWKHDDFACNIRPLITRLFTLHECAAV